MRMPELKSLARDRGLRNYSRMRKAELFAFLTIWFELFSAVQGQRASGTCSCTHFQRFIKPLNLQPLAQHLHIWRKYINREKIKLQSIQVSKLVIPAIIYFCNLGSYTN